jgi:dihydrofolate reductase
MDPVQVMIQYTPGMPNLHLIFARASNGVIGRDNTLPWHLPEDLAHFKRTTLGCPVIMGRKTWDSLPVKFRPLPGRTNVIISRQNDLQVAGATVAHDLNAAIAACGDAPEVWVIGGAQLYTLAAPVATTAVVTEIDLQVEGDAFAPTLGADWTEVAREDHVAANGLKFRFITLHRNRS